MFTLRTIINRFNLSMGKFLYDFKVFGQENLPKEGPFIISLHHTSPLDLFPPAFVQYHRPDLHILVLDAGTEHPLTEWYSRKFNSLPIHKSPSKLNKDTLSKALNVLKQGKPLMLAAEGEMSWDGRPQPYKTGAAWLILRAQVPFVPAALRGAYLIWPRWQTLPKFRGKLRFAIGKPVSIFDSPPKKINNSLLTEVNQRMKEEISRTIEYLKSKESE